jgi:hypothetical protein
MLRVIAQFPRLIVANAVDIEGARVAPVEPINCIRLGDAAPLYARIYAVWTSVTGGGAGSTIQVRGKFCPTSVVPADGNVQEQDLVGKREGTDAFSPVVVFFTGIDPGSGADTSMWVLPNSNGTGAVLPILPFAYATLFNASTAYTGGTVVVGMDLIG